MEDLYHRGHRCKTSAALDFIFTTDRGQVVEVAAEDLPITSPYSPYYDPCAKELTGDGLPVEGVRYLRLKRLRSEPVDPSNIDGPADERSPTSDLPRAREGSTTSIGRHSRAYSPLLIVRTTSSGSNSGSISPAAPVDSVPLTMVYNEYGELVSAHSVLHPGHSKGMSTVQILRIIKKGYHHNYRRKLATVLAEHMDGKNSVVVDNGHLIWGDRLSAWEFKPASSSTRSTTGATPDDTPSSLVAIYSGPPRILEIGCGDGIWCFQVKQMYPDRIIEGIDDTDHWSCVHNDLKLRDFMEVDTEERRSDYFSTVHTSQDHPEFTVRNINHLLRHTKPIPHNLYGLIRARDIFDKVESYKTFLEDVRLILQPDGVVEFLEVDHRPRCFKAGRPRAETKADHTSGPKTNWTDSIADRFKNFDDEQIATDVPGWMERVMMDQKATVRPHDGVPGPQLKSWLEGAGFYDVKQVIIRIPVGGDTKAGKLMRDLIFFKHSNEDEIPNLKSALPAIETDAIASGDYYVNFHVVTGRKPQHSRAGDLLLNGSRQEMTASKYEAMAARTSDGKTNHWKRLDLDSELTGLVQGLSVLKGAPSNITPPPTLNPRPRPTSPLAGTMDGAVELLLDEKNMFDFFCDLAAARENDEI